MRARITGVNTFGFLFGVFLGNLLLRHTDNLSKTLKHKSLSAAEGQRVAKLTLDVLQSLHNEDLFIMKITSRTFMLVFFWTKFVSKLMVLLCQENERPPAILDQLNRWQFSHLF